MSVNPNNQPARDAYARTAGRLLLLTAAVTVVMVIARVAADADQPTLAESLRAIDDSRSAYATSGVARFASGLTLIVGALALSRTWIIRRRLGTPAVPVLFGISGAFTVVSGAAAVIIAISSTPTGDIPTLIEALSDVRWLTGKIGFAAAGAALVVASVYQWRVGGHLRRIAPASAVIGLAMQFIWIDSATIMHPIVGVAFFLWLVAIGTMLATGRVEQHFIAKHGAPEA